MGMPWRSQIRMIRWVRAAVRSWARPGSDLDHGLVILAADDQLSKYPDSGHGGIFQHHDLFVAQALDLLRR
jgi:hypothetical protein